MHAFQYVMSAIVVLVCFFFFFQAEDGIRDYKVTGVQTCALPISPGASFYFVHSYYPVVAGAASPASGRPILRAAWCDYGVTFAAAIEQGRIYATQFHPEKSQRWGLRLLENFAAIVKGGAR